MKFWIIASVTLALVWADKANPKTFVKQQRRGLNEHIVYGNPNVASPPSSKYNVQAHAPPTYHASSYAISKSHGAPHFNPTLLFSPTHEGQNSAKAIPNIDTTKVYQNPSAASTSINPKFQHYQTVPVQGSYRVTAKEKLHISPVAANTQVVYNQYPLPTQGYRNGPTATPGSSFVQQGHAKNQGAIIPGQHQTIVQHGFVPITYAPPLVPVIRQKQQINYQNFVYPTEAPKNVLPIHVQINPRLQEAMQPHYNAYVLQKYYQLTTPPPVLTPYYAEVTPFSFNFENIHRVPTAANTKNPTLPEEIKSPSTSEDEEETPTFEEFNGPKIVEDEEESSTFEEFNESTSDEGTEEPSTYESYYKPSTEEVFKKPSLFEGFQESPQQFQPLTSSERTRKPVSSAPENFKKPTSSQSKPSFQPGSSQKGQTNRYTKTPTIKQSTSGKSGQSKPANHGVHHNSHKGFHPNSDDLNEDDEFRPSQFFKLEENEDDLDDNSSYRVQEDEDEEDNEEKGSKKYNYRSPFFKHSFGSHNNLEVGGKKRVKLGNTRYDIEEPKNTKEPITKYTAYKFTRKGSGKPKVDVIEGEYSQNVPVRTSKFTTSKWFVSESHEE